MLFCLLRQRAPWCPILFALAVVTTASAVTVEEALKLVPIQRDVQFERPAGKDIQDCTVANEQIAGASAIVVRGPGGQVLRTFIDSNKDRNLDQWCYFLNGIEAYRDIDSDFDGKPDQYRWVGLGGSRWGIDRNEDGTIDAWQTISAEELTEEVLGAVRDRDVQRFQRLLLTKAELDALGLGKEMYDELKRRLSTAPQRFDQLVGQQKVVDPRATWVHFGATRPSVLPAGASGNKRDLTVYENVSAMTESGGEHGQLPIGVLVRAGENWRLIDVPTGLLPDDQRLEAGYVLAPTLNKAPEAPADAEDQLTDEMQKMIADVDAIEQKIQAARSPREKAGLHEQQAKLLRQMASKAATQNDQVIWIRQLADTLGTAAQTGDYPAGLKKLYDLYAELAKQDEEAELTGYVKYRWMTTNYSLQLQRKDAKFEEIQEDWLSQLEEFVEAYPKTADAADAMLQLAIAEEYAGNDKKALRWYEEIAGSEGRDTVARKAQGAITRLTSVGKPISLSGETVDGKKLDLSQLRGRIVLIHYWATWCEPCKDDIRRIDKLVAQYGGRQFLPVGVNLDTNKENVTRYLKTNPLSWPQLQDIGGLDGQLASSLGVLTLPTMILLDEKGNVVNRNAHTSDVDDYLDKHLQRQASRR